MTMTTQSREGDVIEPWHRRLARVVQRRLHSHPTLGPAIVLLISVIVFTSLNGRFLQLGNISIMLQQVAVVGVLALAQTAIILIAGIDLSIGAIMILVSIVMAKLAVDSGLPEWLALLIGLATGAACGALNGVLISKRGMPPFIVTLGTLSIFTALGLLYSSARTTNVAPDGLLDWTGTRLTIGTFTITTGVLVMIGLFLLVGFMLRLTAWGRHVYASGDDPAAARLAGIRTQRVILSVYILAGVVIAVAAWLQLGRVGSASTNVSALLNLDSITAVVLGGTSLFGGRGRVLGTLFGALIVETFQNGLALASVPFLFQPLIEGALILVAVGLDQWIRKVRN